ncbi:MAG: hypothetical protein QOH06_5204 [Acidobacteriota bacterium]|nr:hypothetical protein [Acidobacteriota bacterium]
MATGPIPDPAIFPGKGKEVEMANEWLYMNTVNGWDKMDTAVTANADKVPELEVNLGALRTRSQRARQLFAQQAALMAAKQEVTKELQQVIQEGNSLMKFLREGLKAYLGKYSEKLTEFGVQPFRGITRKVAEKPPLPETVAPSDLTPDSVK